MHSALGLLARVGLGDYLPPAQLEDELRRAATRGRIDIVNAIVQQSNINLNSSDKNGWTPLHLAVQNSNFEVVKILLSSGAQPSPRNKDGLTPLHVAANKDNIYIVDSLLQAGAEVDARSNDQRTPLHFAAAHGNMQIVQALTNAGANVQTRDKAGQTPYDFCSGKQGNNIKAFLYQKLQNIPGMPRLLNTSGSPQNLPTYNAPQPQQYPPQYPPAQQPYSPPYNAAPLRNSGYSLVPTPTYNAAPSQPNVSANYNPFLDVPVTGLPRGFSAPPAGVSDDAPPNHALSTPLSQTSPAVTNPPPLTTSAPAKETAAQGPAAPQQETKIAPQAASTPSKAADLQAKKSQGKPPLAIVVSGGGPVGMIFAAMCAIFFQNNVHVTVYEARWTKDESSGMLRWRNEKEGNIRREQVVTLQDDVCADIPKAVFDELFKKVNEVVWPTSHNIPIREVEDRMLEMLQHNKLVKDFVTLLPQRFEQAVFDKLKGKFDLLVGADGARSAVRDICRFPTQDKGHDRALGVAYYIDEKDPAPLPQAANIVLTVAQTRYLLNSSHSKRGYLNIRVTDEEWANVKDGRIPPDVYEAEHSPLWETISNGLKFFGIPKKSVSNVVGIDITLIAASVYVRSLDTIASPESRNIAGQPTAHPLVCLVGDAAMRHHFWPGRGLNSGIKAATALARRVFWAFDANRYGILTLNNFSRFEGFMQWLLSREIEGRSKKILKPPLPEALQTAKDSENWQDNREKFFKRVLLTRDTLEGRSNWPHKNTHVEDTVLHDRITKMSIAVVKELYFVGNWPTEEMAGEEVLASEMCKDPLAALKIGEASS